MSRARTPVQRDIIHRANTIKLRGRRVFPGGGAFATRLYSMRQLDQAVNLLRRRGGPKDKAALMRAGYAPSKGGRRPQ
jgi:hypothetical protein